MSKERAVGNGVREVLRTPDCVGHCKGFGFSLRKMGNHSWVFSCELAYIFPGFCLAAVLGIHSRIAEQESRETRWEAVAEVVRSQILDRF